MPISLYLHDVDKLVAKPDQAISFDLDHVVRRFNSQARHDFDYMAELITNIATWLQRRLKAAKILDQNSRDFPTIRFYNECVAAWLDEIQRESLAPEPSFGEQMARIGRAFVQGAGRMVEAVHESLIIPRFLDTLLEILELVNKSIDRFMVPSADMFDTSKRTASDLFGEMALTARIVLTSKDSIAHFLIDQVVPAYKQLKGGDGKAAAAGIEPLDFGSTLDKLARYMVGGILILAIVPDLVKAIWKSVSISVREQMIQRGIETEAKLYALRRTVLDLFYVDLFNFLKKASSYIGATGDVFMKVFTWLEKFLRLLVQALLEDLSTVVGKIVDWLSQVFKWLTDKLAPVVKHLNLILMVINGLLQDAINMLGVAVEGLSFFDPTGLSDDVADRLEKIKEISDILLSPALERIADTPLIPTPDAFPNIANSLFGSMRMAALEDTLSAIAKDTSELVAGALAKASNTMWDTAKEFTDAADAAARGGSRTRIEQIAKRADKQVNALFGEDIANQKARLASRQKDALAERFETWLADGGFALIGKVVPAYIGEMLAHWRRQEVQGTELQTLLKVDDQTSPHKLAEKAVLGTARIKKITVNARGRVLDDKLVEEIATAFQSAIADAFTSGKQEIKKYAEKKAS